MFLVFSSYKAFHSSAEHDHFWITDYTQAIALAKKEHKKVFVDVGAQFCSICKAIDKNLLHDKDVRAALDTCINVKIDGADSSSPSSELVQKKFCVIGYPTFILIDPEYETELKRWGGELYDTPKETFVTELAQHIDA